MTPPASSFKKATKKEEPPLTAIVILDVFDQRFAPIHDSYSCFGTFPICNIPAINYVMSWLMRTEVRNVKLAVSGLNAQHAENVKREWRMAFDEFTVAACDGATSVGDCIREMHNRELITSDFILISNPTAVVSSTLVPQIAEFRKRRRESQDNMMTLLYSNRENPESFVIGISSETKKLVLFPGANSLNQLKAEKKDFYEGVDIRRDVTITGIAFCSRLIATQFSDNFDFVGIDDVVREILSKDDILGMNIHVEILSPEEKAFCAYDYESLFLLNTLMLERWFHPLSPENTDPSLYFSANPRNIYVQEDGGDISMKANTWILSDLSSTVCLGLNTKIAYDTIIRNSCVGSYSHISSQSKVIGSRIGEHCTIGEKCRIEFAFIGDNVTIPDGTHITRETIIGNDVVYPKEFTITPNSVILKSDVNENNYEELSSHAVGNVFVAKYKSGAPFWRRAVDGKTSFSLEEDGSSSDDLESEKEDDDHDDNTKQFRDEVFESMDKILRSEDPLMRNLILEINSSKLACNVTMDEVARNVFAAFIRLTQRQTLEKMCKLITQWKPLFVNYYATTDESISRKTAEQRKFEFELKRRCQIQLLLAIEDKYEDDRGSGARVPKLVHFLYNADILTEEAILEWAHSIADASELKRIMQPIVDWLMSPDESDEETDDD